MESHSHDNLKSRIERWIALVLCCLVLLVWVVEQVILSSPVDLRSFAPVWLPVAATIFAVSGIIHIGPSLQRLRIQRTLLWSGILLMLWLANGLLFDFLMLAGLIGDPETGQIISVNMPGMAKRMLALLTVVILARKALAYPVASVTTHPGTWYGYAAFFLALPYPVLRLYWALGGTLGLMVPGGAGRGIAPLLLAIPWLLAAVLSLLLVSPRNWKPRRLILAAGWIATTIVAIISPAACWSLIRNPAICDSHNQTGIAIWVFVLFYCSWLLWAITAGAATRSYQLRSARTDRFNVHNAS